jgi:formylglycine-generating enzyme required for sulfatase activity
MTRIIMYWKQYNHTSMKHLLIVIMALFCLTTNAQNQAVRRQGALKEVGISTPKKTMSTKNNRNVSKKTKRSSKTQSAQNGSETSEVTASTAKDNTIDNIQFEPKQAVESKTFTVNGVSFDMMKVKAGSFTMGHTNDENSLYVAEPVHKVTLTRNYYIGKTEVTQALWKAVMGNNPSFFKGDDKPVEFVSWNDCQTFILRLNEATGKNFRLPTEAEWEFAARGGNNSNCYQYSGSNNLLDVAWYTDNSRNTTHDVATKQPNELGLYDMSGNVLEWCSDLFGDYSSNAQYDPAGARSGSDRVRRGGSWDCSALNSQSWHRDCSSPDCSSCNLGFRLAFSESDVLQAEESSIENFRTIDILESEKSVSRGTPQSEQKTEVKTFAVNGVSFDMLKVEADAFTMGATSEMKGADDDEKPAHIVTLTKNYYLGKTEVTQALWKAVMGTNPSANIGDNKPVDLDWRSVDVWDNCQAFISKLNVATGLQFRLPTEAEWEFAARGGKMSRHYQYSGSDNLLAVAWCYNNSSAETHNVAMKQPNELGFYDMTGNVEELCSDWYGAYSSNAQYDPTGSSSGSDRVTRGGCWADDAEYSRFSVRSAGMHDVMGSLGFRLALSEKQVIESITVTAKGVPFDMMRVEAGTFVMEDSQDHTNSRSTEKAVHSVILTKNYYLGKTEVTQSLWKAIMGKNPSRFQGDNLPVEQVSWEDCQKFIAKLNAATGKKFRLPTEAEWEFAAKGGINSCNYQYSGSDNLHDVAWYTDNSSNVTHDVATKQPNELGIYDMSGNVLEWCSDWDGEYSSNTQYDPAGPTSGISRIVRGGSWHDGESLCHSSTRRSHNPDSHPKRFGYGTIAAGRQNNIGFRLLLLE